MTRPDKFTEQAQEALAAAVSGRAGGGDTGKDEMAQIGKWEGLQ